MFLLVVNIAVKNRVILALPILNLVLPILVSSKPVLVENTLYPNCSMVRTALHVQTPSPLVNLFVTKLVFAVILVPRNVTLASAHLAKSRSRFPVAVNQPLSKILAPTFAKLLVVNLLCVIVNVNPSEIVVSMLVVKSAVLQ